MNNVLTASRMLAALQCPRKHFYQYEIGLQSSYSGLAQRIGSAWARALEARWKGLSYEKAFESALSLNDLDELSAAIVGALLAGYYAYYKKDKRDFKIVPEEEFYLDLEYKDFKIAGKRDGRGIKRNGTRVLIESKTTNDSIGPDAQYWQRLKFNMQILQYVDAELQEHGQMPEVLYDVTRKPQIKPKEVKELDVDEIPIVRDQAGERVFKKNGEPKQTADKAKGEYINSHVETPEEFGERLFKDTLERPEFYFCRRQVNVLEGDLEMFRSQRLAIAAMILSSRELEQQWKEDDRNYQMGMAWPRNVLDSTCTYCQFKSFCLQNVEIDENFLPNGYSIQPFNPELNHEHTTTSQDDSTAD